MRRDTVFMLVLALFLGFGLAACDEAKPAGSGVSGDSGTLPGGDSKVPGARELLGGKQLAEKRLPSPRRLGEVLVAEAAGMKRFQEPRVKTNQAMKRVTAKAEYFTGDQYRYDTAMKVEVQWFGKAVMGLEKLGFGMYKPKKLTISGFDALAKHPNPAENDKESSVRMLVAPQLIVQVENDHYDVDAIVSFLSALDFASLAKQAKDGSLFTPSMAEQIQAGLLSTEAVKALLPTAIKSVAASNHQVREDDDAYAFIRQASAHYQMIGQVRIMDAGAAERAKERYPLEGLLKQTVEHYEKSGQEVKRERVSAGGGEAFVLCVGRPGKLNRQAMVFWRAHAGRFVIDGQFQWRPSSQKGQTEEFKQKMGIGLFPDALSQVKGILEGLDIPGLSKK